MSRTKAESYIARLSKTEKKTLLILLSLSPDDKKKSIGMAANMCSKDSEAGARDG